MKRGKATQWLVTAMDVLFVLVLCFAVLLTTMLITTAGESGQKTAYHVSWPLLIAVAGSIGGYLAFMLRNSLKALKRMERLELAEERRSREGGERNDRGGCVQLGGVAGLRGDGGTAADGLCADGTPHSKGA